MLEEITGGEWIFDDDEDCIVAKDEQGETTDVIYLFDLTMCIDNDADKRAICSVPKMVKLLEEVAASDNVFQARAKEILAYIKTPEIE